MSSGSCSNLNGFSNVCTPGESLPSNPSEVVVFVLKSLQGLYSKVLPAASSSVSASINMSASKIASESFRPGVVEFWQKDSVEPTLLRIPFVLIFFVFLWGLNIFILEKMRIQYFHAIKISVSYGIVLSMAAFLFIFYIASITFTSNVLQLSIEDGVVYFYSFMIIILFLLPLPAGSDLIQVFFKTLYLVFSPGNSVSFSEVLLADALTSLSKIFRDLVISGFALFSYFRGENVAHYHDLVILSIAVASTIPYAIRVRQCSIQFITAPEAILRLPISLNILKYISSLPAIWLAASQGLGYNIPNIVNLITTFATVNSVFSFLWDLSMDWGFITFFRTGKIQFRQRTHYHWTFYVLATLLNLTLRFSWKATQFNYFKSLHPATLVIVLEILEVCRRGVWNLIRIEWETIVQLDKLASSSKNNETDKSNVNNNSTEKNKEDKEITNKEKTIVDDKNKVKK